MATAKSNHWCWNDAEFLSKEVKHLISDKKMVPSNSSISQLDPFLDSDNIICVGGRLRKSSLAEADHPVILPRKSEVSDMIIQWSHNSVTHGARGLTLNHLKE